ncbi:MAG: hypothetical protein N2559_02260, partial [Anaerolineae bacterium]|nr:hypothetical protein [Anaerolineae bacterium]
MGKLTRRQFLALAGLEGLAVLLSSCAPKEQPTPSPVPTLTPTTPPPTPTPTKVPEVKIQSLREAVAVFRAADKISPPYPKEEMIATGGANPVTLRVVRWGEHQFEIGPKDNATIVHFLDNRVSVVLPFAGAPEQAKPTVNGMLMIPEMTGPS